METLSASQLMSDVKFYGDYSRFSEETKEYESWFDAVRRAMGMHRKKYKDKITQELSTLIDFAETAYLNKEVLGAQRALQFGGDQLLTKHAKMYNCVSSYADRAEFFGEFMWLMLCGCGAGFSVQKHHVAKLPKIRQRTKSVKRFEVPDSIEGWSQAFDILMSSFFETGKHTEYSGHPIWFDLSKIRPKGSKISGGFKAPGADPLQYALTKVELLLTKASEERKNLKPIEVYDICMFMADAVISGGVRRSATICMFSKDDEEMIKAKTGDWFSVNPQRGRSNNSVMLKRDEVSFEEFQQIMHSVQQSGEPGFIFTDSYDFTYNPCVTADTPILTDKGYVQIIETIGKPTNVWNGKEWSEVTPFSTGVNPLMMVLLSDGTHLDCTPYHKWVLSDGSRVETKDLTDGDKLGKFKMPTVCVGEEYSIDAYSQGFYSGDGNTGSTVSSLYAPKYCVSDRLIGRVYSNSDEHRKVWNHGPMFAKNFVPINGSQEYCLNWLAGIMDSDGNLMRNPNSTALCINANDKKFLTDIRLMLTRLGVQAKVVDMYDEGYKDMPNGKGGKTSYFCEKTYRLLINATDVKHLVEIGIKFSRILFDDINPNRDARRFVTVIGVEDLQREEETYCFTEAKNNTGTFNGIVTGQCVEVGKYPQTSEGISGWQACNLTEINGSKCDTAEKFYDACKAASILGTLQAGYTDFAFLTQASKEIIEKEALIGVGVTGWTNNPKVLFDEDVMRRGAEIVKEYNKKVAELIGINQAARTTVVKPSGNASVILQTASGIHGEHSPRYLRHVQMNNEVEVLQTIKELFPQMVEPSVWSTNGTDSVMAFPIVSKEGSLYKTDLLGIKQLEYVKKVQQVWIETGTNVELCSDKRLRHNVSNTISVDDWDEVTRYIYDNRQWFCGISLMAASGDKAFPQAPFTEVLTEQQIVEKYGAASLFASGLVTRALDAFGDLWAATSCALGYGEKIEEESHETVNKRDWVRQFTKFAKSNFEGDVNKTSDCLKDVYNLHKFMKISRALDTEIDIRKHLKHKSYVDVGSLAGAACSGGVCEMTF